MKVDNEDRLHALLYGLGLTPQSVVRAMTMDPNDLMNMAQQLNGYKTGVIANINSDLELELEYNSLQHQRVPEGLSHDDDDDGREWVKITKIVVPTQFDKEQLLLAFEYIHDLKELDTDYKAVNTIAHMYQSPDIIVVLQDPHVD